MVFTANEGGQGWRDYHKRVRSLSPGVVPAIAKQIQGHDARVMLLGVTRELAQLGTELTAVDWCQEQIDKVWLGDRPGRTALLADWRDMDLPRGHFTAAIGDGSLSTLVWPGDYRRTLERVAAALRPRALLVMRCYVAPDEPEALEQIADDAFAGRIVSFYSARWRIAMAVAGSGNVAVSAIRDAFERAFPDRQALAVATGWSPETIDQIDAYRGSDLIYSFLNRDDLVASLAGTFSRPRFVSSGDYPMAERYPLLVAERSA